MLEAFIDLWKASPILGLIVTIMGILFGGSLLLSLFGGSLRMANDPYNFMQQMYEQYGIQPIEFVVQSRFDLVQFRNRHPAMYNEMLTAGLIPIDQQTKNAMFYYLRRENDAQTSN